jgi:hypothetical protein
LASLLAGFVGRLRRRGECLHQGRFGQQLADQFFRAGLAVHVGHQVGELAACFQQLAQRVDLARDRRRREVIHALEGEVDRHVAFAGERVGHLHRDARLHGLQAFVEIVDVDVEELAVGHRRQRLGGLAGQIGQHAHDEGQLDLFLGAVDFDVVLDLHPRRTIARDEFLATLFAHD